MRYGGPIQSVHALCRALAAQGHVTDVFTTNVDGPGDSDVPLERPVDLEGVQVTYFPSRRMRRLYWSPPMRRALFARVADYDLVHVHAIYLWPTWTAARAARARHVPYIVSPRGMLVPQLIQRKNRWIKQAWIRLIEKPNLERAAAVHTTSEIEAHHLGGFDWSLPKVVTIPHGVDDPPATGAATLSPDIAAAIAGAPPVLAFGRISWEKGLDRLIAALPLVPMARVIIAGGDGGQAAVARRSRHGKLGVADRVTIIARHVAGADKEALFASAARLRHDVAVGEFRARGFRGDAARRCRCWRRPMSACPRSCAKAQAGVIVDPSPDGIARGLSDAAPGSRREPRHGRERSRAGDRRIRMERSGRAHGRGLSRRHRGAGWARAMMELLEQSPFDLSE